MGENCFPTQFVDNSSNSFPYIELIGAASHALLCAGCRLEKPMRLIAKIELFFLDSSIFKILVNRNCRNPARETESTQNDVQQIRNCRRLIAQAA